MKSNENRVPRTTAEDQIGDRWEKRDASAGTGEVREFSLIVTGKFNDWSLLMKGGRDEHGEGVWPLRLLHEAGFEKVPRGVEPADQSATLPYAHKPKTNE